MATNGAPATDKLGPFIQIGTVFTARPSEALVLLCHASERASAHILRCDRDRLASAGIL